MLSRNITTNGDILPGMFAYDRTRPDRCYPDAATAEADGLRPAKR